MKQNVSDLRCNKAKGKPVWKILLSLRLCWLNDLTKVFVNVDPKISVQNRWFGENQRTNVMKFGVESLKTVLLFLEFRAMLSIDENLEMVFFGRTWLNFRFRALKAKTNFFFDFRLINPQICSFNELWPIASGFGGICFWRTLLNWSRSERTMTPGVSVGLWTFRPGRKTDKRKLDVHFRYHFYPSAFLLRTDVQFGKMCSEFCRTLLREISVEIELLNFRF